MLIENSLKRSLYQQNYLALEVLKSSDFKSQINILWRQIEQEKESPQKPTLAKYRSKKTIAKQIIPEKNIILNLLALYIMGMRPIKFGGKTIATDKRDVVYITEESDGEMEIIIQKTNLYLYQLQKKFGDDGGFDKFLYQLLKDNNLFFNPNFGLENIEDSFSKALEAFGKDLAKSDKKKDYPEEVVSYKPTPYTYEETPYTPEDEAKDTSYTSVTVSQPTNLTPTETRATQPRSLNVTSTEISADEVITKIKELLTSSGIKIENSIILKSKIESKKKKIELTIAQELSPIFTKILTKHLEKSLTVDEYTSYNPIALDNIFSATILEYQKTDKYHEWQRELEQERKSEEDKKLTIALELSSQSENKRSQKIYFDKWKNYASQNYQQFADFLDGFNGLKNIAKLGNVRLKGSYLYGDLLGIKQVKAKDIDLEIFIKNLFFDSESKLRSDDEIKKLITDNFVGYPIDVAKIKIGENPYYAQFELQESSGKVIDLSFYDSDKPPVSDWIFAIDALRMDLTDVLRSDQPITQDRLHLQNPSLALGFAAQHPNNDINQILSSIKNETQLVNPQAQDLVFNTVKKINNKVLNIEEIQSLYKSHDGFKAAFEKNWNMIIIRGVDNFQKRCHNSGIEDWDTIIKQIRTPKVTISAKSNTPLVPKEIVLG